MRLRSGKVEEITENPQPLPEGLIEQTVAKAHETLDKAPNLH